MYDVVPEVRTLWTRLFERVSALSGVALEPVEHRAPAPIDALWARADLGCVFMCGWPWTMATPRPTLLAAPIPDFARYGDRPIYVTDFAVRAADPARRLADTFGGRIGWTVEHSHSGFNAPRRHLMRYRTGERPRLYQEAVGRLMSPRGVIDALLAGSIDVGPLDGFWLDLFRRHCPDEAARLRVIESTDPAPIPPLVASAAVPDESAARIRRALLTLHEDATVGDLLHAVGVARFVAVEPAAYEAVAPRWAEEARLAFYAAPG
jgi:ABC-type phosphate/phosphonate transport system substrate-binding protein